jgi:hypothetical protein
MAAATKIPGALKSTMGPAVTDRLKGEKPGALRAAAAASVSGIAAGILVYKVLRQ